MYDLPALVDAEGDSSKSQSPVASYNTKGSRLTCVFLADGKKAGVAPRFAPTLAPAPSAGGVTFAEPAEEEDEEDEDEEDEEEDEDMYEQDGGDDDEEEEEDGVEVEFEDEDEDEEGDEDEHEME